VMKSSFSFNARLFAAATVFCCESSFPSSITYSCACSVCVGVLVFSCWCKWWGMLCCKVFGHVIACCDVRVCLGIFCWFVLFDCCCKSLSDVWFNYDCGVVYLIWSVCWTGIWLTSW
jgi:hypothetical protein